MFFFLKEKEETTLKEEIKSTPIQTKRVQIKKSRGVVYLGHLPHGFFEEQIKDYFKQFGSVTRVRVSRSKKVCFNNIYLN